MFSHFSTSDFEEEEDDTRTVSFGFKLKDTTTTPSTMDVLVPTTPYTWPGPDDTANMVMDIGHKIMQGLTAD